MYKAILCASHLSIFACVAMYTLCQEFISVLLLRSLPPFLFSVFFNKLAVYVSVTLPYAYMCNGHHAYGLVALLMLFACLNFAGCIVPTTKELLENLSLVLL